MIAFLHTMERRVVASLPIIQGNQTHEELMRIKVAVTHDVFHDLMTRVGNYSSTQLSLYFIETILTMADIVSDSPQAFAVLYPDFCSRGADAKTFIDQMSYDPEYNPSGLPSFPNGDIAPTLRDGPTKEEKKWDEDLKKAGTFKELLNPLGCSEGDEREECKAKFLTRDPRYAEFERWEAKFNPSYSHQPMEEAEKERAILDEQHKQAQLEYQRQHQQQQNNTITPVLLSTTSFPLH
jgi:hypothetical protein